MSDMVKISHSKGSIMCFLVKTNKPTKQKKPHNLMRNLWRDLLLLYLDSCVKNILDISVEEQCLNLGFRIALTEYILGKLYLFQKKNIC